MTWANQKRRMTQTWARQIAQHTYWYHEVLLDSCAFTIDLLVDSVWICISGGSVSSP
jgi:hypothetical protein